MDTSRASAEREVFEIAFAAQALGRVLRLLIQRLDASLDLLDFQRCAERHQQAAVDDQVEYAVDGLIAAGWTPVDVHEVVRRKITTPAVAHVLDVVATVTARHPARLVHHAWTNQLDQLGAKPLATGPLSPSLAWGRASGLDWPATFACILEVLVVICALPVVERVLPAPGESIAREPDADGIDARVLRRVRGLLAKAESTEHPGEAEALTAKAQELMTRYSIDRAMADTQEHLRAQPVCRRMWLDNPYVDAKALLVVEVAEANNCRAVQTSAWGFVTMIGHAADLDVTELLTTSLLVQATPAAAAAGPQTSRSGRSRTRSFRQSFLVAYAGRIGERLRGSAHSAEADYDNGLRGTLVPILAARREAVDDKVTEAFPQLVERRVSASDPTGFGAGRAAADLARLDVRNAVPAG